MFSADVSSVNVIEEYVNVVDSVVTGRVVYRKRTFHGLLDDNTFRIERGGFNFVKRSFQLVA